MSDIQNFKIQKGVLKKYIGNETEIAVPDGVTEIKAYAFFECLCAESVIIPEGVIKIGEGAFYGCKNLKNVTIPESVTEIGCHAFGSCTKLRSAVLPKGLERIPYELFQYCDQLESITILEGATEIEPSAFRCCSRLKKINIPESVTKISSSAFSRCKSLANEEGFVIVRNILFGYYGESEHVVIPEGVETIGEEAFAGRDIKHVTVSNGVKTIGTEAFYDCIKLKSVIIPESVTKIGERAFLECPKLTEISLAGTKRRLTAGVFGKKLPKGLIASAVLLSSGMNDAAFVDYILNEKVWSSLSAAEQTEIFMKRQGKTLSEAYAQCIAKEAAEKMADEFLKILMGKKPSVKECNAVACFMSTVANQTPLPLLKTLYDRLKEIKSAEQALDVIAKDAFLMKKLKL
ncbi:MAG: leucine-rich repeat domain-containing protein [Ruminococcaceae bacterium]|nr:leucine-rich repeat domain-containing protein [Oscillospiraceae bacterium]